MIHEYILKDKNGRWLAQVLLTDDGMFAAVSEYGNFAYAWRSFGSNFREFLLSLDLGYFAEKLETGMAYVVSNNKVRSGCRRFSEKVIPILQAAIKLTLDSEEPIMAPYKE